MLDRAGRWIALLMLVCCAGVMAEQLPATPMLGLVPVGTDPGAPVVVQDVLPGATASALGVVAGDTLRQVNGTAVQDFAQLLTLVRAVSVDEPLTMDVSRNGQPLQLSGVMRSRPREASTIARVSYGQVRFGDDLLRSITHRPVSLADADKAPAVYFIQGYTCDSIDYGMLPDVTTRRLVDQFVAAGYVVFRMEKPGVGESRSSVDCTDIDFTTESNAFLAGLVSLKQQRGVDPERITLWGHSLGVLHAAVMANQEPVASVVGYGGVYKNWHDYMLDIYRLQSVKHFGVSERTATANTQRVAPFLHQWLRTDTPWSALLAMPEVQRAIAGDLLPISDDRVFDRHYSFFRDLNRYDFEALWRELDAPVLMMHGSLDIQAIDDEWTHDVVAANRSPQSTALTIPGAEHAFMRYANADAYQQARRAGEHRPVAPGESFDTRIGQATLDWLEALATPPLSSPVSGINRVSYPAPEAVKPFVGNGFLLRHGGTLYAATVKHALLEARTEAMSSVSINGHISAWDIHPNGDPTQRVRLGALINTDESEALDMAILSRDWLLFEVVENHSPLRVLELRTTPLSTGETLTAYGCTYATAETCRQDAYAGRYLGATEDNLRIALDEHDPRTLRGLSGSPVLDEQGLLVGIVSNVLPSETGEGFDFAPANLRYLKTLLDL